MIHSTAYEGELYRGQVKTGASRNAAPIPDDIVPIIEAWRQICPDTSPDALMFPTHGKGERAGSTVPRRAKSFLKWRIYPIAKKMNIPRRLVTFQVMRRTLGTDLQQHGTIKDAQGVLRHASIKTTGDVYVQQIPQSVRAAINSRTRAILAQRRPVGEQSEHATCPNVSQLEEVAVQRCRVGMASQRVVSVWIFARVEQKSNDLDMTEIRCQIKCQMAVLRVGARQAADGHLRCARGAAATGKSIRAPRLINPFIASNSPCKAVACAALLGFAR